MISVYNTNLPRQFKQQKTEVVVVVVVLWWGFGLMVVVVWSCENIKPWHTSSNVSTDHGIQIHDVYSWLDEGEDDGKTVRELKLRNRTSEEQHRAALVRLAII